MTESVYHTGYAIDLDLSRDDLGHPERPGLWDEIHRPGHFRPGLLVCREPDDAGRECRQVMYVKVLPGGRRIACHLNSAVGAHPTRDTSHRRALRDRIARGAQQAGFDAVLDEDPRSGRRRTDVLVRGAGGRSIGWEVQLRPITARSVTDRSRQARAGGVTPLWTVFDRSSEAIDRAPWTRLDRIADWRRIAGTQLNVRGGVRELRMERCDERRAEPCPDRGWGRCHRWHPVWDVALGVYLEDLIARTAGGEYVPLFEPSKRGRGGRHMWVKTNDKETALQGRPEPNPWAFEDEDAGPDAEPGPRDDGARIDTAAWLTASAEEGPGWIAVADKYRPPEDLVELRNHFVDADTLCDRLAARLPSGAAIADGASVDAALAAKVASARAERSRALLLVNRHPWWSGVDNRYAAQQELWKIARDRHRA